MKDCAALSIAKTDRCRSTRAGSDRGVAILMMGTSFCPDLHEPQDLGRKGDLPILLDSFRFP